MDPIPSSRYQAPYPENARERGQKGHVFLRVRVDKYGFARQVEVVISSGYAQLDQAAIDSIKDRWRWEPPPAECRESGVITSVSFNWGLSWVHGEPQPDPIYLDNLLYPAQARARGEGGEGKVEYTVSTDYKVTEAHVTESTRSPELDAAMIAFIRARNFIVDGTTSTTATKSQRFEFVPHDNPDTPKALMGPAIVPDPKYLMGTLPFYTYVEPYPAPSRANDCGRATPVFLERNRTNINPPYPIEAVATGGNGRTVLDVLVDKGGTASEVTVAQSSGSPILDQAAVKGVKGLYHFQAPPLECADQGVQLRVPMDWFIHGGRSRLMPGDPEYPTEAVAAMLSGIGRVQIVRSGDGDIKLTKVVVSTNSPVLDAAMIKAVTDTRFTPGTRENRTPWFLDQTIEFVGDPDAMRAAAAAPVRRIAPVLPPPSATNDCGRSADIYLAPVNSSHVLPQIPMLAVGDVRVIPGVSVPLPARLFQAQGALKMQVLVDKDGKAASVTVVDSSAPPEMERAVTSTVKENYRWEPPPPACADRGVMLDVNYVYTYAPEKLQIYAGDPDYPEAARAKSMGAAGIIEIRYHSDKIDDAKIVVSTNSPELDAAMIRLVSDRLLDDMRADPKPESAIQNFALMFMPGFVESPKQRAARASQAQAATSPPASSAPAP